ncbi:hypothetical protein [Methylobacterium oxalidis]|uniref:Lysozyme inhibitor LprI N-terminal domain-containing protein n=1 Tax=Methylobacterium oxalidis TaxID=944322 RepID=A0A512J1R0_9HYPH|nr:hypothetical protein [Methylobacterium oxalidis]GEP03853.1 hypothetical protein MOX02_18910 [Methylobacterium oxalidis]GJE31273.1 hypothetical protein LDDCCGHA_1450 [Methylobacterium oxalidis]GLS65289.1 hypothetical protein GCM10007888_36710 [Methylobacterium oxalidis]
MRLMLCLPIVLLACSPSAADTKAAAVLSSLEARWHGCVRDVYARERSVQRKAASQLSALDECKEHEDAYVAAILEVRAAEGKAARREGRTLTARAKAWATSVLGYVVDPVSSWLGAVTH